MLDKKQVQDSIGRIDSTLAQLTTNREGHVVLANDVKLVQQCCLEYFNGKVETEDGRINKPIIDPPISDEDK